MRGAASQCEGHETMVDRQRIEGWKAIAAHFDRGVRTVQRWERELGMPVRRRGTGRGEVVFAFSDELNAWWTGSESASEAPDQGALPHVAGADAEAPRTVDVDAAADGLEPRRGLAARWRRWALSSRSRATLLAASVVVGVGAIAWLFDHGWPVRPSTAAANRLNPASARVENGALIVRAVDGTILWSKTFGFELKQDLYSAAERQGRSLLLIRDVDGDGSNEVLLGAPWAKPAPEAEGFFLFEADGSTRFHHRPTHRVRFGPYTGAPPWELTHLAIGADDAKRKTIWAAFSVSYFPSVLERLDPAGTVESAYWSDGHITAVHFGTLEGRRVALVSSANNEWKGGALAVLDAARPSATAPALDPEYRCVEGCPAADPLAFVVWPGSPLITPLGGTEPVWGRVSVRDDGQIELTTGKPGNWDDVLKEPALSGCRQYVLDSRLRLIRAELADDYAQVYELLAQVRQFPPFDPRPERHLYPMLRWEGGRFVRVDGPEVGPLAGGAAARSHVSR